MDDLFSYMRSLCAETKVCGETEFRYFTRRKEYTCTTYLVFHPEGDDCLNVAVLSLLRAEEMDSHVELLPSLMEDDKTYRFASSTTHVSASFDGLVELCQPKLRSLERLVNFLSDLQEEMKSTQKP